MAVQPPTGPPKPPPGKTLDYLIKILDSPLTDEMKVNSLKEWIE